MAEVYRAEDTLLERIVAVKVLHPQHISDPTFLARFQQEARFAAKVAHPNIVSVYDVGSDGATHYIVMEYVEGRSLKAVIQDEGSLPVGRATDLASQILSALSFAHQKGLIHRDVKPQNVLIGTDGQVKVADFGIARAATGAQTTTGIVLATVQYGSPEQLSGQPATEASDLYSLGVVLYEMLTGRLPFEAESSVAVALMHVQSQPPSPRGLNPAIPISLESIVLKSLAKVAADRFRSASEMRYALRAYLQGDGQATTTFRPSALDSAISAGGSRPTNRSASGAASADPPKRSGVDWLAVFLGLLVFVLVAGAVPLGLQVFNSYARQADPAATQTAIALAAARPSTTSSAGNSSPTVAVTPTPSPQPSPTTTAIPEVAVPRLIGKRLDLAQKEVEALGLKLRLESEESSPVYPVGVITNQSPTPDRKIAVGGEVGVTVSKGPQQVLVEAVVGIPLTEAQTRLVAVGFRVKVTPRSHDQIPSGIVMEQQPGALEQASRGSEVTLFVSSGPAPTPTPSPTATAKPSPSPTRTPLATATTPPKPTAAPTSVPTPVLSLPGVPAAGSALKVDLAAGNLAMVAGPRISYPGFDCTEQAGRVCVLIVSATKAQTVSLNLLVTGRNWVGVWQTATPDQAVVWQSPEFWKASTGYCTGGCTTAQFGSFTDSLLKGQFACQPSLPCPPAP